MPGHAGPRGFTADTDGGSYRGPVHDDTGSYPSFPSLGDPLGNPLGNPLGDVLGNPLGNGAGHAPGNGAGGSMGNGAFQVPRPYGTDDVRRSDPPPTAGVSPMEPEQEEYLPIFAAVESAWFRRPPAGQPQEEPETGADGAAGPAEPVPSGEDAWRTAADAGWRAAAKASEPSLGGITAAGLPKRTPRANLVPGTAAQPAPAQEQAQQRAQEPGQQPAQQPGRHAHQPQRPAPVQPARSADRMRSRMAGFQQGVRRGRQEVRRQEEQRE